tara:strand:- start:4652 stop:5290 length:639 start_codon:yes stop_codon:yes gene_type:complete
MQNKKKILKNKFSHFIFDVDGVILNSKENMRLSWNETSIKFNLKIKFAQYFKNIGLPFPTILKKININSNHRNIEKEYKKNSIKHFKKINLYRNIKKFISHLEEKKIPYYIVTSKDRKRTEQFLHEYKIFPRSIHCPSTKLKGKPKPDLINYCIKINNIKKKDCCFIGDTEYDYMASKNAKVSFVFANYGYGKNNNKYKLIINKPEDLFNFI